MSEGMGDKLKGTAKDVVGKVQEAVGVLTDNPEQQAAGQAKQAEADADRVRGAVKDAIDEVKHAVREAVAD